MAIEPKVLPHVRWLRRRCWRRVLSVCMCFVFPQADACPLLPNGSAVQRPCQARRCRRAAAPRKKRSIEPLSPPNRLAPKRPHAVACSVVSCMIVVAWCWLLLLLPFDVCCCCCLLLVAGCCLVLSLLLLPAPFPAPIPRALSPRPFPAPFPAPIPRALSRALSTRPFPRPFHAPFPAPIPVTMRAHSPRPFIKNRGCVREGRKRAHTRARKRAHERAPNGRRKGTQPGT